MASNRAEAYIWGTVTISVICFLSLGGIVLWPLLKKNSKGRRRWMALFTSLAVATLCADAMLHLVPEALGLHAHSPDAHANEVGHSEGLPHAHEAVHGKIPSDNGSNDELMHAGDHDGHHDHVDHDEADHGQEDHDDDDPHDKVGDGFKFHGEHSGHDEENSNHTRRMKIMAEDHHEEGDGRAYGGRDDHYDHQSQQRLPDWNTTMGKMAAIVITIYLLYVAEFVSQNYSNHHHGDDHHHHHNHAVGTEMKCTPDHCRAQCWTVKEEVAQNGSATNGANGHMNHCFTDSSLESQVSSTDSKPALVETSSSSDRFTFDSSNDDLAYSQKPVCFDFRPIALMILIGDAVHNFADGLAVGASFQSSTLRGLATSFAVACHELPHEIGDFAVLLDSGLSVKKALFMNFLSSITAFLGLYVGLAVGDNEEFRQWIFTFAVGIFLYVAWIDMLSHLKHCGGDDTWYVSLAVQNVGFVSGFVVIFMLGFFEEEIPRLFGAAHDAH